MSLALSPIVDLTRGIPATRDASMTWMRFMGIDPDDPTSFSTLRSYGIAVEDEPWTYACVFKTAAACQSVPLRVYQRVGRDLIPIEDTNNGPSHDAGTRLQRLFDWVNPIDMTGDDLKAYTAACWFLYGGYYLQKVRGRFGGEPQELYWLSPPDVQVDSQDGRRVDQYQYRPSKGSPKTILPPDMIVHKRFNPRDPLAMLSPLSSVRNEIQVGIQASLHTSSLLKNHSIPAQAIVAQKGAEISNSDKRTLRQMFAELRGAKNAGKTPVITEPVDIKDISVHSQDAEYMLAREIARKAICAVLGMPPVVAGDDDKTNVYGNWRDARRAWWQDTLITYLDGQATTYNNWLVPDFDPDGSYGLWVAYDYSQIEALQEPWSQRVMGLTMLQDRGDIVRNEVRAHLRLGKPMKGGDEPEPLTKVTLKGDAMPGSAMGTYIPTDEVVAPAPVVEEPGGLPQIGMSDLGGASRAAARIEMFGRGLYTHPAVEQFLADRSRPLDATWLLGEPVSAAVRSVIEAGLARRYSPAQLARGVPSERYPGLMGEQS